MSRYLVVLHDAAEPTPEARDALQQAIASKFKLSTEEAAKFFAHLPATVKVERDLKRAEAYRAALEQLGAVVEVIEYGPKDQPESTSILDSALKDQLTTLNSHIAQPDAASKQQTNELSFSLEEPTPQPVNADHTPETPTENLIEFELSAPAEVTAQPKPQPADEAPPAGSSPETFFDFALEESTSPAPRPPLPLEQPLSRDAAAEAQMGAGPAASALSIEGPTGIEVDSSLAAPAPVKPEPEDNIPAAPAVEIPRASAERPAEVELPRVMFSEQAPATKRSKAIPYLIGALLVSGLLSYGYTVLTQAPVEKVKVTVDVGTLLKQQERIVGGAAVKEVPTEAVEHRRFKTSAPAGSSAAQVAFETSGTEVHSFSIDIEFPPPPKLTAEQVVSGVKPPPYMHKLQAEGMRGTRSADGTLSVAGLAKVYIADQSAARRLSVPIEISATIDPRDSHVEGSWTAKQFVEELGPAEAPTVKRLQEKGYAVYAEGRFRAELVLPSADKAGSAPRPEADAAAEKTTR